MSTDLNKALDKALKGTRVARPEYMESIKAFLANDSDAAPPLLFLSGCGGAGKSVVTELFKQEQKNSKAPTLVAAILLNENSFPTDKQTGNAQVEWNGQLKAFVDQLDGQCNVHELPILPFHAFKSFYESCEDAGDADKLFMRRHPWLAKSTLAVLVLGGLLQLPNLPFGGLMGIPAFLIPYTVLMVLGLALNLFPSLPRRIHDNWTNRACYRALGVRPGQFDDNKKPPGHPLDTTLTDAFRYELNAWLGRLGKRRPRVVLIVDIDTLPSDTNVRDRLRDHLDRLVGPFIKDPPENKVELPFLRSNLRMIVASKFQNFPDSGESALQTAIADALRVVMLEPHQAWEYVCRAMRNARDHYGDDDRGKLFRELCAYIDQFGSEKGIPLDGKHWQELTRPAALTFGPGDALNTLQQLAFVRIEAPQTLAVALYRRVAYFVHKGSEWRSDPAKSLRDWYSACAVEYETSELERSFKGEHSILNTAQLLAWFDDPLDLDGGISEEEWKSLIRPEKKAQYTPWVTMRTEHSDLLRDMSSSDETEPRMRLHPDLLGLLQERGRHFRDAPGLLPAAIAAAASNMRSREETPDSQLRHAELALYCIAGYGLDEYVFPGDDRLADIADVFRFLTERFEAIPERAANEPDPSGVRTERIFLRAARTAAQLIYPAQRIHPGKLGWLVRDGKNAALTYLTVFLERQGMRGLPYAACTAIRAARFRIQAFLEKYPDQVDSALAARVKAAMGISGEASVVHPEEARKILVDPAASLAERTAAASVIYDLRKKLPGDFSAKAWQVLADVDLSAASDPEMLTCLDLSRKLGNVLAARKLHADGASAAASIQGKWILPFLDRVDGLLEDPALHDDTRWVLHWYEFRALIYWLAEVSQHGVGPEHLDIGPILVATRKVARQMQETDHVPPRDLLNDMHAEAGKLSSRLGDHRSGDVEAALSALLHLLKHWETRYLEAIHEDVQKLISQCPPDNDPRPVFDRLVEGVAFSMLRPGHEAASPESRRALLELYARQVIAQWQSWQGRIFGRRPPTASQVQAAVEAFASRDYAAGTEALSQALLEMLGRFNPTSDIATGDFAVARIERLDTRGIELTMGQSNLNIDIPESLVPSPMHAASRNSEEELRGRRTRLAGEYVGRLLLVNVTRVTRSGAATGTQIKVTARGSEFVGKTLHLFFPITAGWSTAIPTLESRPDGKLHKWFGSVWMGGSNSIAVAKCSAQAKTAVLSNGGCLIKELLDLTSLKRLVIFSAAADRENEMREFINGLFSDLWLQSRGDSRIVLVNRAGKNDDRKNRTFLQLFRKAFDEEAIIYGWDDESASNKKPADDGNDGEGDDDMLEDALSEIA